MNKNEYFTKEFLDICKKTVKKRLKQAENMISYDKCEICKYMQGICKECPVNKECKKEYMKLVYHIKGFLKNSLYEIEKLRKKVKYE